MRLKDSPSSSYWVVIAIIALLMGLLLPCLSLAKARAKRIVCQNNLHQGSTAIFMYAQDFDHRLPVGNIVNTQAAGYRRSWTRRISWPWSITSP